MSGTNKKGSSHSLLQAELISLLGAGVTSLLEAEATSRLEAELTSLLVWECFFKVFKVVTLSGTAVAIVVKSSKYKVRKAYLMRQGSCSTKY